MPRIGRFLAAVLLVVAAGCANQDDRGLEGSPDTEAKPVVEIVAPEGGTEVEVPFTIELDSNVTLGAGEFHVHVFFDGNSDEYEIVEGNSYEVTQLEPGHHTIAVSLRNPDHSDAGASDEAAITVTGGGGGGGGGADTGADTGYDY